jgi:hypothetical protein
MKLPRSNPPFSIAIQNALIQEKFPQFKYSRESSTWIGELRPSLSSPAYLVQIKYKLYALPKVRVLRPKLHPDAPHIYHDDNTLCLYYPPDDSWNHRKYLGNTILLWTAEWLYYYELWLATGQWFGPEAPHGNTKSQHLVE